MSEKTFKTQGEMSPEIREAFSKLKDQLLILLIKRLGGSVEVTCKDVDESTANDVLMMEIRNRIFYLSCGKKQ